jgi:hypothetical protein
MDGQRDSFHVTGWTSDGWSHFDPAFHESEEQMRSLHAEFAHPIPTEEAIDTIGKHGPIFDVNAGTGYWASMMQQRGINVLPIDRHPPNIPVMTADFTHIPSHNREWASVMVGGPTVAELMNRRTMFMAYPPGRSLSNEGDPFAYKALSGFKGDKFIYVGEDATMHGGNPTMGSKPFFDLLAKEWKPTEQVKLPQWLTFDGVDRDRLTVYERKQ